MEVNKDEAERCVEMAEKFLSAGKHEKAEKFLIKAEKLFSTPRSKALLEQLQMLKAFKPSGENAAKKPKASAQKKEEKVEKDYTEEQLEAVKRIKKCKDYYEVLGVTKESTDTDIKKAYKKLALVLHPDKNKAPGSSEAFKAIGNAVAILTDPEKRKQYDLYGSDEERISARHQNAGYREYNYSRGFEADITAEELFNMFFNGFPSSNNVYVRRGNTQWRRQQDGRHHQEEANGHTLLGQALPLIVLVLLSVWGTMFISDPVYSHVKNANFPVLRTTKSLKIPYYVKENFHSTYQGSMKRLEASVEEEHIANLRNNCYRERNYRESMMWKAKNFGDKALFEKAQSVTTPSCDALKSIHNRFI